MIWGLRKKISGREISILLGVFVLFIAFPFPVFADPLASFLWKIVNTLFGWMVGMSGWLLDFSINQMVVGFGDMYINTGLGNTIDTLWKTVRDIFNLTFIFGLVFIGLKMIFKSNDSGAQKLLVSLIIAALLVNFSLFITKFVVDFSNIAATQVASAFPKSSKPDSNLPAVAGAFMDRMGLNTIFNWGTNKDGTDRKFDSNMDGVYGYIFGTMIIYIIVTFVFIGGALLLIIRFAALNLYMLLSPLMFIGMIFPGAQGVANDYWKGFLSRAFFAPAYILMLYFSYQILSMFLATGEGNKNFAAIFGKGGEANFYAVIPPFVLTAIFLIASIVVAQKMSSNGGAGVISMQNAMMNRVKSGVKKTAFTMAKPITKPATALGRAPIRLARMGTNKLGEYGVKKLNNVQSGGGTMSKLAKLNAIDRTFRGGGEAMAGAQFGTGETNKDNRDYRQKTEARANQTAMENQRAVVLAQAQKDLTDRTKTDVDLKTALDDLGKTIRDMSKEEKENLDLKQLTDKNIAVHLTDSDIDNLEKSGKYGAADIKSIKDARSNAFKSIATHGTTHTTTNSAGVVTGHPVPNAATIDQRGDIARRNVKDIGKLPIEMFKEQAMYTHITPAMLEERIKNGMTSAEKTAIRIALANHLQIPLNTTPLGSNQLLKSDPWVKWENSNSAFAAQFFS